MAPESEHEQFEALAQARRLLRDAGGDALPRMPWQPDGVPPDDATLVRWALWRANRAVGGADHEQLRAALRLLESAKAETDALETGLLAAARMEGMTWGEVASGLGVRSPQAAQQRLQRAERRRDHGAPA